MAAALPPAPCKYWSSDLRCSSALAILLLRLRQQRKFSLRMVFHMAAAHSRALETMMIRTERVGPEDLKE